VVVALAGGAVGSVIDPVAAPAAAAPRARSRLSFKDQRELERLPAAIDALERELAALNARMAATDYRHTPARDMAADGLRIGEIERLLLEQLARWDALESRATPPAPSR